MTKSPWADYPTNIEPDDEPYQPAPLVTAAIMTFCGVMTMLALWKAAELAAAVYAYFGG